MWGGADSCRAVGTLYKMDLIAPCPEMYIRYQTLSLADMASISSFKSMTHAGNSCYLLRYGVIRKSAVPLGLGQLVLPPPRWMTHLNILNFLDQDTYLLATQQPHTLRAELAAMKARTSVRRSQLYRYTSPGERMLSVTAGLDTAL